MTDQQYLDALDSLFGGPDETKIECRTTRLVRTRREHACQCPQREHNQHAIPAGNRAVLDHAIADGKWGSCYVCLPCLESWDAHCETGAKWCAAKEEEGE